VRLYTLNGNDFTARFPLVVAAVAALPVRSCLIDGEATVSDEAGLAVFELLRSFRHDHAFFAPDNPVRRGCRLLGVEGPEETLDQKIRGQRERSWK
jgi:hypothetical protein